MPALAQDIGSQNAGGWERLEALFAEAVSLPGQSQADFVERETASDPDLRDRLKALLRHDEGAAGRIAQSVRNAAQAASRPVDWLGQRFGPWRIVREIGRGGMGVVFLASRADDEYRKTVALKISLEWCDPELLRERFRHERQMLAGLEHPGIARFLDGGTHHGIPWFAMEYVEGSPITEYARRREMNLRDRIELFRQVCAAVQYAHQHLLVHGDLKPGNILVNEDGIPKLLDFGIARLLTPDAPPAASSCTPHYASPEQLRAEPITTRTDVYSLGLILSELLTGQRCQYVDCGAIVAMAISKEPARRYNSAQALSDDLDRYLRGLPVQARPATAIYRAWKLANRHRVAVTAGVLLAASIAGGMAATVRQQRRAEHRSGQVRKLANSVLFDMQDRLQNLPGATEARESAVRTALGYLNDLAKDGGQDRSMALDLAAAYLKIGDVQGYPVLPSLGHREAALESYRKARAIAERLAAVDAAVDNHPGASNARRLQARSYQRVAAMLRALGRPGAIEEYRRGLAIADSLYAAEPGDREDAEVLVTILISLGQAEAAAGNVMEASRLWLRGSEANGYKPAGQSQQTAIRALMYKGDLEAAERTAREGIRAREALVAEQPANTASRRNLMNAYLEMAYLYFHPAFLSYGDGRTASKFHQKALAVAHELAASDPGNQTAQSDLALAEAEACAALSQSNPARGIEHCREALAIAARWPSLLDTDAMLASMADGLHRLGRDTEALQSLRSAIQFRESLVRRDPWRYSVRQRLVRSYNQMGALLLDTNDLAGALEYDRRALALAEELASAIPSNLLSQRDLADTWEGLGKYYERRDRHEAQAMYRKSLDIWNAWPGFAASGQMDRDRRLRAERAVARASVVSTK